MSLLDDLKKQADQANAKQEEDDSQTLKMSQRNWNTLVPKLQLIITYMRELVENLNIIKPDDKVNYPFVEGVTFENLTRENFRIRKADNNSVRNFSLRYDIVGERDIDFAIPNDANAANMRTLLKEKKIRFTETSIDSRKSQFKLLPKMSIAFQYFADLENCMVVLRIYNFKKPEIQEIRYKPEAITEELMEETAKYILNKENKFSALSGNDVDDEALEKIRSKLRKDGKIPKDGKAKQGSQTKKKSFFGKILK